MQDSQMAQSVKSLPAMKETHVQSLCWEDPLEKEMTTHINILTWRTPWTEVPGGLQSMVSQRVGLNWVANTFTFHFHLSKDLKPKYFLNLIYEKGQGGRHIQSSSHLSRKKNVHIYWLKGKYYLHWKLLEHITEYSPCTHLIYFKESKCAGILLMWSYLYQIEKQLYCKSYKFAINHIGNIGCLM